jgi:alkylation response protein AidB-like acyl-CoA dehydrogenase
VTALGYIRRSKESGARTISLEDQRARIADYCHGQGWALVEVLADDGVSGGRRERLDRLAERVKVTGARVVVVYYLDRFARDLAATLDAVEHPGPTTLLHVLASKAAAAETALAVTDTALRACGGTGFTKSLGLERAFRDARASAVMAPTTDLLHEFVGRALVGMELL